jgi:hypothetical protein
VDSRAVREGFIELTKKVVLDNAKVLDEKAKDVLEEAEGLIDDAWKYCKVEDENMQLYVIGILQPMAYGVYFDLLLGNLPAFFMELRLLLESLACCYMAKFSLEDPSLGIARSDVSASKILREFSKATSLGNKPNELWSKLSNDWCHALGIIAKVMEHLEKYSIPPFSSIPLFYVPFWEEASGLVNEAGKRLREFRQILRSAITPILPEAPA